MANEVVRKIAMAMAEKIQIEICDLEEALLADSEIIKNWRTGMRLEELDLELRVKIDVVPKHNITAPPDDILMSEFFSVSNLVHYIENPHLRTRINTCLSRHMQGDGEGLRTLIFAKATMREFLAVGTKREIMRMDYVGPVVFAEIQRTLQMAGYPEIPTAS